MKKYLQIALGLVIGGLILWFLMKATDWNKVWVEIQEAHWGWLGLGVALLFLTFVTRVQRWTYIVRTAGPVSFRSLFSATQIGFLGNFVLPGRAGEVIRALVLNRLSGIPFVKCFAFVALDRLTDLFGLIAVLFVSVLAFHPQQDFVLPEEFFGDYTISKNMIQSGALFTCLAVMGIVGVFAAFYLKQDLFLRLSNATLGRASKPLAARLNQMMVHFAEGLHVFRSPVDMAKSLGFSLLTWGVSTVCYLCVVLAFGIEAPWYAPFVIMSLLAVAVSIPGLPGFVGPFHIAIMGGLYITNPAVDLNAAFAAAIMAHLLNLVPVVMVGAYCLYLEGFGLLELRRSGSGPADGE